MAVADQVMHLFHWRFPGGEMFGLYQRREDADQACEGRPGSEVISMPVMPESGSLQYNGPCDAPGATVSADGQHCRCLICSRCGHHTGNSHQGHYWSLCKLTGTDRGFHFCCPGDCELGCPDCQGSGIVDAPNDCGGCCDYPGIAHEPACGIEPCPRGCEVPAPGEQTTQDVARNIVNQLADLWQVDPAIRQATNDQADNFVTRLIAGHHQETA